MLPIKLERNTAHLGYTPSPNNRKIHCYQSRFLRLIIRIFGWGVVKVQKDGKNIYLSKKDLVIWARQKDTHLHVKRRIKNRALINLVSKLCQAELNTLKENPLQGGVSSTSSARKAFDREGKPVEQGNSTHYFNLDGLAKEDFTLNLYTATNAPVDCIKVVVDKATYFLDSQELAGRFHLKLKKVKECAKNGTLSDLIEQKKATFEKIDQITRDFEPMFKRIQGLKSPAITKTQLMKIVRIASKNEAFITSKTGFVIPLPNTCLKDRKVIVTRDDLGKFHLALFTKLDAVADEGAFGTIHFVDCPISNREKVVKLPSPKMKGSEKEILNEIKILNILNKNGPVDGIEKRTKGTFIIELATGEHQVAYLIKKYERDLLHLVFSKKEISNQEFLKAFYNIVVGTKYCHENAIVHGDIKLENILVKNSRFFLGDFGGACILGNTPEGGYEQGTFTSTYWLKKEREQADLAAANRDREQFNKILKARDVYQIGCVLYEALTRQRFPKKTIPNFEETLLSSQGIDPNIIKLILKMANADINQRPTIQEVATEFAAHLNHAR